MIVFSNTTPFIALSSIGKLELLPALFDEIYVVDAVVAECAEGGRIIVPDLTRLSWIRVISSEVSEPHPLLLSLGHGEKHTINMAFKMKANYVVLDEKIGRNVAEYLGLVVTGTLGVLLKARQQKLIDSFTACALAMQAQGIRYNMNLLKKLAWHVGETL
ncbi:hypothetical protein U27_03583 [Candidatus Vecturithrix granuli]|uniref:DUF3368 domain-containing protein n=1 Tax=Vecturithrix granuli TaxID=1499967 RepID=A0A081BWB5_VECG1|nr:hypothetical protein U27_03583 [Candidatus Vecturithrix granuli]